MEKLKSSPNLPTENRKSYPENNLPWFVHLIWILFWVVALWFVVSQFPVIQSEFLSPS